MKCTRCGKEMTIKPVETGTDSNGEPVYTRYAFCYHCKIKVNLDKKTETESEEKEEAASKKKSVKRPSLPTVSASKKRRRKKRKKKQKRERRGGIWKFLVFLIILVLVVFAIYTYRKPIIAFSKQIYHTYIEKNEETQKNEETFTQP